ncbi:MAG TPA: cysteine--tRNA ligase, partial [Flavobacteriales bacterium]|nr:cysteine--tRNA ligase [Flavobacteriales bacterium]
VRYWMHGNMLTVNGRKMAKSEGNGFTPEELVTGNHKLLERGYSAMTVRFFMLQSHYASTLDFSNAALQAAEKGLEKMMAAVVTLAALKGGDGPASAEVAALEQACYDAMNDDLNTPIMIAHLFDGVRMINSANDGKLALSREDIARLNGLFNAMLFDVLGMCKEEEARGDDGALEGVMRLIIEMRSEAKATRNFALSDRIRDQLAAVGISIKDSKEGSTWDRK